MAQSLTDESLQGGGGGGGGVDVHCEAEVTGNYSQKNDIYLLEQITMVAGLEADPPWMVAVR